MLLNRAVFGADVGCTCSLGCKAHRLNIASRGNENSWLGLGALIAILRSLSNREEEDLVLFVIIQGSQQSDVGRDNPGLDAEADDAIGRHPETGIGLGWWCSCCNRRPRASMMCWL